METAALDGFGSAPDSVAMDGVYDYIIIGSGSVGSALAYRLGDRSGGTLNAIAFQVGGNPLGEALVGERDGGPLHILGRIRRNHFHSSRTMQVEIQDAAPRFGLTFLSGI